MVPVHVEDSAGQGDDGIDRVKFLCSVKRGIFNLVKWFPVVWKDRWWDYEFLLIVLRFKLRDMEKNFREKGIHVHAEKDTNKMQRCLYALNRLLDFDYNEMVFRHHDKKWGKAKIDWVDTDNKKFKELRISRCNVITEEDKERERKEYRGLSGHVEYLIGQDLDYLFSMMRKHVRNWWD